MPSQEGAHAVTVLHGSAIEVFGRSRQEKDSIPGDRTCTVRCFDEAIELHFSPSDREDTAVALNAESFVARRTAVGRCSESVSLDEPRSRLLVHRLQ